MLFQFLKKCVDQNPLCRQKGNLLGQFQLLLLKSLMAAHVLLIAFIGVIAATTLFAAVHEQIIDERSQVSGFQLDRLHSGLQCAIIRNGIQALCVVGNDFFFPGQNAVERRNKAFFEALFLQCGCLALLSLLELVVAVPPPCHILGIRVPLFPTVKAAAVPANDTAGENGYALGASPCGFTPAELFLHHLKNLWPDNRRMVL